MNTNFSISKLLSSIDKINCSFLESNNFGKVFDLILKEARTLLKIDYGLIGIVNEDQQSVEVTAKIGSTIKIDPIPLKKTIVGWSAFSRKQIIIKNYKENSKFSSINKSSSSGICIPMLLDGKVNGVLLMEFNSYTKFSQEFLKIAEIFSFEANKALSKIWLVDQLKAKTNQLQSLIKLSRNLAAKLDRDSILSNLAYEARLLLKCHSSALFLFTKNNNLLELHTMFGPNGKGGDNSQIDLTDSAIGGQLRGKSKLKFIIFCLLKKMHLTQSF